MVLPVSQQGLYQDGNSIFEDLHVTNALHYDFKKSGTIEVRNINVVGVITATEFSGVDATSLKDDGGTVKIQATTTGATHSGRAVFNEVELQGKLYDGDGNFGTSGQLLSSDGTDTTWIDASSTSVANANNVGVNVNSTDADQFITFVGSTSGNNPIRVDSDLKYNPLTNTIATIKINDLELVGELKDGDGNFGSSGQVLASDGTDTAWVNTGSLTAGAASEVGVTAVTDSGNHFLTFVDSSSGNENIKVNTNFTYDPSTNTLSQINIAGNSSAVNLNVTGDLEVTGELKDGDGNFGTSGQLLSSDGTNTAWVNAGTPTAITVTDESSDTTCFPLFATGATGNQSPKTGTNLTFNSSNGALTATAFSGDGSSLTQLHASNLSTGTVSANRLPNTYTRAAGVTIQATGAGNDVRLDAADHIILESGEEETGAIYFRGNQGTSSYRFAKSGTGNESTEGFLNFDNLTADRTFTFPNATGTIALTSDLFSGDYDDLTDKPTLNFVTDNASDELTGGTYTLNSSTDQKVIFQGSSNPYIRFREGTTNKGYLQWNSGGYMRLTNQESGEELRLGNGNDGLTFVVNSSSKTVYHTGNLTPFDGNYNSLSNKPSLFDGAYNSLSGKPTIPTNNNQLTNGRGFITGTDVRSMNEATSTGQSTSTSNSDTNKVTLSISTVSNSRVLVAYGFEIAHSDTSNKSCVATVKGTNVSFVGGNRVESHKDTSFELFHGNVLDISSHTGTRTYIIAFRRSTSGGSVRIRNAYLTAIEMSV